MPSLLSHTHTHTHLTPLTPPPSQVPSDDQIYAVNGAVWQCPKAALVSTLTLIHALVLTQAVILNLAPTLTPLTLPLTR